jgi:hypothetical protein
MTPKTALMALAGLLLVACGEGDATPATTSGAGSDGSTATTEQATASPPTESSLPAGPPVFDQRTLGNNLELDSFVATLTVSTTSGGMLSENVATIAFVREPLSVSELATYAYSGGQDSDRRYLVGGRSYEETSSGDWYLYESGSPSAPHLGSTADLRSGNLSGVLTADLVGEETFAGLPANHFVFDETDLTNYSAYTPENPSPTVEGDFYLAADGNYVLYTHYKETSEFITREVTEVLSQVNQLTEITLPSDMAPMTQALDIGAALSSLLPPGSELSDMVRYRNGIGVDYYGFMTPIRNNDDFIDFYRTMPPTDGWTVAHIGHVKPHLEKINCETSVECVILRKGGDQLVVSFGNGIILEFDREHVFSAL